MKDPKETTEEYVARFKREQAEAEAAHQERLQKLRDEAAAAAAEREKVKQAEQAQRETDRAAKALAEFDARHKAPALRAWVAQGGDAAEFERVWPAEAARIRLQEVAREQEQARQTMRRLVQNW